MHIGSYSSRGYADHEPLRPRKLLLHRHEMRKLIGKVTERGMTIVPVRMYFKDGRVKMAISLAKGKQAHDRRETIKTARNRPRDPGRHQRTAAVDRRRGAGSAGLGRLRPSFAGCYHPDSDASPTF